eukprot:TRINITY_DN11466_c0_g1_i1.p1 TRINITY_DN11466_c0_g1~~TRINITY_DN11466_c0_g1_i1.p1  ORF type:complete len:942 (+),score=168.46 TRINITY_DN11466_c0_g1_i1:136-2961(+)
MEVEPAITDGEPPKFAPTYEPIECSGEQPGPRCGHTLTSVAAVGEPDSAGYVAAKLILFGGATALEGSGGAAAGGAAGIRLAGATADVHSFDVASRTWTKLVPVGEPPSPRAAHAATAVGTMVVIQGGIGPAGLATDDLHVLDLTQAKPRWHRVVVQGAGPGPRYGHVMALVGQRFLLSISGNDGKRPLADVWSLDTAAKPYEWRKLEPEGEGPPPCMYSTASARSDGLLLLCGGRDGNSVPLAGAYGLARHRDGRWEWAVAPGISPSARYQHAAVFVNARLHVSGGALGGGRMVEDSSSVAVLDTTAGVWCDRKSVVNAPRTGRYSADAPGGDAAIELTRRCRHASASVGEVIYTYGGLRGGVLLDDLLMAEDISSPDGPSTPTPGAELSVPASGEDGDEEGESGEEKVELAEAVAPPLDGSKDDDINQKNAATRDKWQTEESGEKMSKISSEEAEAAKRALETAQQRDGADPDEMAMPASAKDDEGEMDRDFPLSGKSSGASSPSSSQSPPHNRNSATPHVRLHYRAVVVAAESNGHLGGLVRQLSIDQFENEGRRVSFGTPDSLKLKNKTLERTRSMPGIHKKVISWLLKPRGWKPPAKRAFFLDAQEISELCEGAEAHFKNEPSVLQIRAPVKIFGDLHGQFGDLMRLFDEYGSPSTAGDITYIDYLFLGDYVDRGQHSLETIVLLLALKMENPRNLHLIRGNHEAADINALFGFRIECIERMGEAAGIWVWQRINQLFNWLPLAALIEKKIICMHGGIGRSIHHVDQIEALQRPITMEAGSMVLMDLLWSDPTENDSVEGLRPNARGPGLVTFGPDRVMEFCKNNDLQLIVRAHECVMDGFERFASGHLITLFSATNYCGTANNAGAILVLGRDLVVVPKLIHPLPPQAGSPTANPGEVPQPGEDVWMQELNVQRPPTPTRGRPQPNTDRNSLAWI